MPKKARLTSNALPKIPQLLVRKIYKTGQTRGADDDEIFQNRVGRNSTVLIPYAYWDLCSKPPAGEDKFENGFIALVPPPVYFGDKNIATTLAQKGLVLGDNAVVFYQTRAEWNDFNPNKCRWKPAESRIKPLKGKYVARVPATTALKKGEKIIHGFAKTKSKGAGIRIYEYASSSTLLATRLQLEALFWLSHDAEAVMVANSMTAEDVKKRKSAVLKKCDEAGLLDYKSLIKSRALDKNNNTVCPLCLENLSANGFLSRLEQAEGREVHDLTVTQLNLFHVSELRVGVFNHRPYNMAWGHHHCNTVTKDSGIEDTLKWMYSVVQRNIDGGHFAPSKSAS
jgi:hypothetical protein